MHVRPLARRGSGRHRIGTSRSDLQAFIGMLDMIIHEREVRHASNARIERRHDSTIDKAKFLSELVNEGDI